MDGRIVFHIDFDYFYAQCEEIRDPELRTKPVAVCVFSDRGGDSGAVATANYIAREYGVKSGMPIAFAKNRLRERDDAVFLPTDFGYYGDISEKAMKIIRDHGDIFEYVGRDEAYIDVSERTGRSYDRAAHLAQQLKNAIRRELGMTCSVGISRNRLVAKIASDYKKPDGLTIVPDARVKKFLEPLKIRDIPGIGKKTEKALAEMGMKTIGDLRGPEVFTLVQRFGRKTGTYIYNSAKGINEESVSEREPRIQFSKIMTLSRNSKEPEFLHESIDAICEELHKTVSENKCTFKSVGIQMVQADLTQKTKSRMLRNPTAGILILKKTAGQLLDEALQDQTKQVRRLGVRVSELADIKGQSSMDAYF